jgi:AcrR family transcriptional regulator
MDRRIRKTREALYSAFTSLIVERGYDAISVQDIIDEADVGRTTFYAHFKSKDELLQFGFQKLQDDLEPLLSGAASENSWGFVEPLLLHARAHAGLYLALLKGGGGSLADMEFQSIVEGIVADELGRRTERHLEVAMLTGALIFAIRSWIASGARQPPSEVATSFRQLASTFESDRSGENAP